MKSKINGRLLLIAGLAISLTLIFSTVVFYKLFQKEIMEGLQTEAKVLKNSEMFQKGHYVGPDMEMGGIRITVADHEGRVVYDNVADVEKMENHSRRPEIQQAFKNGNGQSIRKSTTLGKNTFYYALKLDEQHVLRVAKEKGSIWSMFISTLPITILTAVLLFVLCVVISNFLTRSLVAPVEQMATHMDDVEGVPPYKELQPFLTIIRKQHKDIISNASMRQEFTANVSHELKTPLTAISGYSELIKNRMADEEDVVRFAGEIHRNSQRLLTLINDIIRLSELDVGTTEIPMEEVDLYEVAETCTQLLDLNAKNNEIEILLKGKKCLIRANRQMIEELVYNLCDNSIRYNSPGGTVDVETYYEGDRAVLTVKDNGIGISPENQKRVFERFYRVDKSRSKKSGGTGLGLAIVKHVVEKNHGILQMDSEEGIGTTVRIIFCSAKDSPI
ncbi:MAG: ATP-binding protein [Lachnospiraceae bacterium]